MRQRKSVGEYLAFLSLKCEVEPDKFLSALRQAGSSMKTDCGGFSVECRGRIESKQVFLVRNSTGIVAQFRVPNEFFNDSGDSLVRFMSTKMVRKYLSKKRNQAHDCSIKDVRSGMTHINLKARVLSVAKPRHVITRYGNYADVAKALIGDETGTIALCLWNEQINAISVGGTVKIGNARASIFKGERQLTIGAKGVLDWAEDFKFQDVPSLALKT